MSRILVITDYPAGAVSGYATICKPLCNGLVDLGHEVFMIAFSNRGEEHWEKFPILPVENASYAQAAINNLGILWKPDFIVCAMDIPNLDRIFGTMKKPVAKYIAITPMENGPLMMSWAMILAEYDKVFFISELGEQEARKVGLTNVGHLQVGIDTNVWRRTDKKEHDEKRKRLGFASTDKIVLTVADNQERKNLWAGMAIVAKLCRDNPDTCFKYVVVTRPNNPPGWKLQELAKMMGIQDQYIEFGRGLSTEELRDLYVAADAFLLPSKAEGLGIPLLEAMAVGVPCVGTKTGAITELLTNRGWLVNPEYSYIDVWGNSKRDFISVSEGAALLEEALFGALAYDTREYIASRNWGVCIEQFNNALMELSHG